MSSSKAVKYSGTLIIPDSLEKIALSHFISSSRNLTSSFEAFLMELRWSFHFYTMTQADLAGFFSCYYKLPSFLNGIFFVAAY